eukprot:6848790-Pyramimonas_sp.AAC.1
MLHTLSGGPASGKLALSEPLDKVPRVVGPCYSRVPTLSPLRMRRSAGDCILSLRYTKSENS